MGTVIIREIEWVPVENRLPDDFVKVDVWMTTPLPTFTLGWADSFRVINAFRRAGMWWYPLESGQAQALRSECITHWAIIQGPQS
jgi:hypothetical protein